MNKAFSLIAVSAAGALLALNAYSGQSTDEEVRQLSAALGRIMASKRLPKCVDYDSVYANSGALECGRTWRITAKDLEGTDFHFVQVKMPAPSPLPPQDVHVLKTKSSGSEFSYVQVRLAVDLAQGEPMSVPRFQCFGWLVNGLPSSGNVGGVWLVSRPNDDSRGRDLYLQRGSPARYWRLRPEAAGAYRALDGTYTARVAGDRAEVFENGALKSNCRSLGR
ncbi:MAG: hypothetical protein HY078_01510 [Elusimicrobia bacterium]|nr:hypothetical protein [Elusimicrobiota bacterium]